ncbi:MAG: DUF1841 family protein [Neisseriaceae bacterium]|nr:DUF1841 family protein [Neisseriaceae bacterium]
MFNINTNDSRQFFADAWAMRHITQDALQQRVIKIIDAHPEYQPIVENLEKWKDHNWLPEQGETNPFLHMSLHLALQEQVAMNQPFGIAEIHQKLCEKTGDTMQAEHLMMDALVEMIWQAQRYGGGFNVNGYITQLRRLIDLGEEDKPRLNPHEV